MLSEPISVAVLPSVDSNKLSSSTLSSLLPRGLERDVSNAVDLSTSDDEDTFVEAGTFTPQLRHGTAEDCGNRSRMEDRHCAQMLPAPERSLADSASDMEAPQELLTGFYAVFDGHNGTSAAQFAAEHMAQFLLSDSSFSNKPSVALVNSFLRSDHEFCEAVCAGRCQESGSTALVALVAGNQLVVANAGDSRAVLSRRGKAMQLSTDHKPLAEQSRVVAAGGRVCGEGLLNGELTVSRALGDFQLADLKSRAPEGGGFEGPLIANPEVMCHTLEAEDEFLLLACDGLWDVFSSQRAIEFARSRLQQHNDPQQCSQDLIDEALRRHATDNVSVVTVCFSPGAPPSRLVRTSGGVSRTVSRNGLSMLSEALPGLISQPGLMMLQETR